MIKRTNTNVTRHMLSRFNMLLCAKEKSKQKQNKENKFKKKLFLKISLTTTSVTGINFTTLAVSSTHNSFLSQHGEIIDFCYTGLSKYHPAGGMKTGKARLQ